jgi:hypothetical protein
MPTNVVRSPRTAILALAAFLVSLPTGALAPADALWGKAVEISRRNKAWVPGSTVFRIELLDEQGRSQERWETKMLLSPGTDGEPVPVVESASHNGKDVTAREKENQARRNEDSRRKGRQPYRMTEDPFDPDLQDGVEVSVTGETRTVGGRECVLYTFRVSRKQGSAMEGTAALDRTSGAPVEVSYTVNPLPTGVQKMTTVLRYSPGPAGEGFLSSVSLEGTGGLLFIKKVFRTTVSLDGYWSRPQT